MPHQSIFLFSLTQRLSDSHNCCTASGHGSEKIENTLSEYSMSNGNSFRYTLSIAQRITSVGTIKLLNIKPHDEIVLSNIGREIRSFPFRLRKVGYIQVQRLSRY